MDCNIERYDWNIDELNCDIERYDWNIDEIRGFFDGSNCDIEVVKWYDEGRIRGSEWRRYYGKVLRKEGAKI